ncbi:hypothetical protein MOO46_05930 [Apilactobacillus apisilvae]|uniref:Surface layer protein A domain-containing protein n=1 Tax=Apilactobacillus apisilvae TaxID=2923364 RepID=A0ABY4PGS5_9LACO|nr:hypothetical protein [Apilactobacillus apisilvae]UQS84782.1 hypothetical protein MOO46_05930 [Apilactobacillus apisilvae]
MKSIKKTVLVSAILLSGIGLFSPNIASANINSSKAKVMPNASSKYWAKYRKVTVTKNTTVYQNKIVVPHYKSSDKKDGVLKKGSTVYLSNKMRKMADVSYPWIIKNAKYKPSNNNKTEVSYIYSVNNESNNWFKINQ